MGWNNQELTERYVYFYVKRRGGTPVGRKEGLIQGLWKQEVTAKPQVYRVGIEDILLIFVKKRGDDEVFALRYQKLFHPSQDFLLRKDHNDVPCRSEP